MGVGHLAVGFAAKRWAPRASLGWLVLAPIFVDLLWGMFVLLGVERARITPGITRSNPLDLEYIGVSHSLIAVLGWSALLAGVYFIAVQRDRRAALILLLGVFSHFVLDWIAHRPDMPLLPSGPRIGLGLWDHPLLAFCTENALLVLGVWLYTRATRPRSRAAAIGFGSVVALLFASNVAAYFGPMPASITPVAAGNFALIPVRFLFHFIDRRRTLAV